MSEKQLDDNIRETNLIQAISEPGYHFNLKQGTLKLTISECLTYKATKLLFIFELFQSIKM